MRLQIVFIIFILVIPLPGILLEDSGVGLCQTSHTRDDSKSLATTILPMSNFTEIFRNETITIEHSTSFEESRAVLYEGCNIIINSTEDLCSLDNYGTLSLRNCIIEPVGQSPWQIETWAQSRIEVLDSTLTATGSEYCILNIMGDSAIVESCTFYGCPQRAITAYSCSGASIRNNWIENSTFASIDVSDCSSATVMRNRINSFTEYGICVWSSSDVELENNVICNGGLHGIIVDSSEYITITENRVNGSVYDGIYCRRSNNIYVLENSVFHSSSLYLDQCRNSVASGNTVYDCAKLRVGFSDNITVSDNIVSSTWEDGINVIDSEMVSVIRNLIEKANFEGIGAEDISQCVFSDNTVLDAGYCGIWLNRAEDITISNNTIISPEYSGIDVEDSAKVVIEANEISKTGNYGINLPEVTDLSVVGNIINETTEACVILLNSEEGKFFLNAFLPSSSRYSDVINCEDISFNNMKYGNFYKYCSCSDDDNDGFCDSVQIITNGIQDIHPIHDLALIMALRNGAEPSPPAIDVQTLTLDVTAGSSEVSILIDDDSEIVRVLLNLSYDDGEKWKSIELHPREGGIWSASIDTPTMSKDILAVFTAVDEYGNAAITEQITVDVQLDFITVLIQNQLIVYLILVSCILGFVTVRMNRTEIPQDCEVLIPLSKVRLDDLADFLRQLLSDEEMLTIMKLVGAFVEDTLLNTEDNQSEIGWRTRNQIMEETGLTKRFIYYDGNLIDKLAKFCFIETRESPSYWGGQTHQFRINIENHLLAEIVSRQISS